MQQTFFQKYKVLILGMVSAVCIALAEFTVAPVTDWLVVGYAAFVAAGSYLARNLRGQWVTIVGIVLGSAATIYTSAHDGVPLNVAQLLMTAVVQFGLAVAPPPKDRGYEHTSTIIQAKEEGKAITATNEAKPETTFLSQSPKTQ